MAAILFRLALLAGGLAAVEIGLGSALVEGSVAGWALVVLIGLPMVLAGSASFILPMFRGSNQRGSTDA